MDYVDGAELGATLAAADKPVLLQFSADWCAPCQQMAPMVDEVAAMFAGRVDILKIDIVRDKTLADQFGVSSIPNFVFVQDGKARGRMIGSTTRSRFVAFLEDELES